jgi:hypothetical protein
MSSSKFIAENETMVKLWINWYSGWLVLISNFLKQLSDLNIGTNMKMYLSKNAIIPNIKNTNTAKKINLIYFLSLQASICFYSF